MKRGFLNNPKGKKGLSSKPSSTNPETRVAGLGTPTPSDDSLETLSALFQDVLRLQAGSTNASGTGSSPLSPAMVQELFKKVTEVKAGAASSQTPGGKLEETLDNTFSSTGENRVQNIKFDGVAVPEDYQSKNVPIIKSDPAKMDHDATALLMTTIPTRYYSGTGDPDGHSEWIVHASTKAKVVNAPGYPQPVPKPKFAASSYVIKSTPNMGMGVFATRDIKMGELIFAERPLLVTPRSNISVVRKLGPEIKKYDQATQMAIAAMEWEKLLGIAVDRMAAEDKEEFMKLANSHKHDGSGPILGIVRTNGFGMGSEVYDGHELRADMANAYSGVTKIGSRINHSCMPNVDMSLSKTSFSFQFKALIDIKNGDELFYSYCAMDVSVAQRRAELAPYGFVCHCPACEHATPQTDSLRKEYKNKTMEYLLNLNWLGAGGVAESVIDPVLKLKDGLVKEGLAYTSEYKSTVLMLQKFYEGIGMKSKAKPYEEEYEKYKLPNGMLSMFGQ